MNKTESPNFDRGVNVFLNHYLALLNVRVPVSGTPPEVADAALADTTQKVISLEVRTAPAAFRAMELSAKTLLQGVIDDYQQGVRHG